jgi:hypothetical protein
MTDVDSYSSALDWAAKAGGKQHVLLGNGFSMAFDPSIFGYAALAARATDKSLLSTGVSQLMARLGTPDFEATMRRLEAAITVLVALGESTYEATIVHLQEAVVELREALAHSIADLHPDHPNTIAVERYLSVRRFLQPFERIYTVSYDLLLYWALMQEIPDGALVHEGRSHDDGFRDSRVDGDTTVLWDLYDPFAQCVFYLHGALHLYLGDDGLRKLTWIRTGERLIDQTREQLALGRYPHYVAESGSAEKLDRINRSAYLSRGLRSLSSVGGSIVIYGHSLDANDDHVLEAVVRSKVKRVAISIYGDPSTPANQRIIMTGQGLPARRRSRVPLEVRFYDAADVHLWEPV